MHTTCLDLFQDSLLSSTKCVAVISEDEQLSYLDFDVRSNQLARYLISKGVGAEDVVAIALDRCPDLLIAIFAVLKAGAAYLPLDPTYPIKRLADMLDNSRCKYLISTTNFFSQLNRIENKVALLDQHIVKHEAKLCAIDDKGFYQILSSFSGSQVSNVDRLQPLLPDHPAYFIYTSGSSGQAKAVIGTHAALLNRIQWLGSRIPWTDDEITLSRSSIAFIDASTECLAPLCLGRTVHLCSDQEKNDPLAMIDLMRRYKVFRVNLVPSLIPSWIESTRHHSEGLHGNLIISGEYLSPALALDVSQSFSNCKVFNFYGMTETCGDSSFVQYQQFDALSRGQACDTIGKSISDTTLYILDAKLKAVCGQEIGEIYIAGIGLARGYAYRPGETALRFLPNPFDTPGSRMYRTGDLGQFNPDGTIRYIGRADRQINIKGVRVELGEIEKALLEQPSIAQVTVQTKTLQGHLKIVAYWVPSELGPLPIDDDIDARLRQTLHQFMIPASYVRMQSFPTTPNGKLDVRALPEPTPRAQPNYVAPQTAHERLISGLYEHLLNVDYVGRDDDFFSLGADSLTAIQLISKTWKATGRRLALKDIFEYSVVHDLARHLSTIDPLALPTPSVDLKHDAAFPVLSHGQIRHWLLEKIDHAGSSYNLPVALRLHKHIDAVVLQHALMMIVNRHQPLRTAILENLGTLSARLLDVQDCGNVLTVEDMSGFQTEDIEKIIENKISICIDHVFNLSSDCLLRAHLMQLSDSESVLVMVVHHSASDGLSTKILLNDLSHFYEACLQGTEPHLSPLSITYADFAAWQRQWIEHGTHVAEQLEYWKGELSQAPALLELPTQVLRRADRTRQAGYASISISSERVDSLKDLAKRHHTTLFVVLMAAYATLLERLAAQKSVVIGFPVAGRVMPDCEQLVGFFVNTLPLCIRIDESKSVDHLIRMVRTQVVAAISHQDVPFNVLVESLAPERTLTYTPVFQAMFTWQGESLPESCLGDDTIQYLATPMAYTKFDVNLVLDLDPDGHVNGVLEYDASLFSPHTAKSWVRQLECIYGGFLLDGQASLVSLPWVDLSERLTVLETFNLTARPIAKSSVMTLFELQAQRIPDSIALVHGEVRLNYAELDQRANQLARYLIDQSIGPDDVVAIAVERSINMLVAIFAVLKTGAAYLPLDVEYPIERLVWMIQDSQAKRLITTQRSIENIFKHSLVIEKTDSVQSELLSKLSHSILDEPVFQQALLNYSNKKITHAELVKPIEPDHLAYMIYTSGSTGKPKAVAVLRRGLDNLIDWYVKTLSLNTKDSTLLISAIGFDLTQKNLFAPLVSGGKLCLPSSYALDFPNIVSECRRHQITFLNCTPSTFYALLDLAQPSHFIAFDTLRWLILGGEPIQPSKLNPWFMSGRCQVDLMNSYGPTECTDITTTHVFTLMESVQSVPIGKPIHNVSQYILNSALSPVPIGIAGDLYIAGIGVARGYWQRPGLTAERFIADPFSDDGSRMYRTGDKARWLDDGTIEYLGRVDRQLKIRGFRIEPGEIETEIHKYIEVSSVVVCLRDVAQEKRLIAYLVPDNFDAELDLISLKQELEAHLPAYMVPTSFVALEHLPMTPNGKVDLRALPDPILISEQLIDHHAPKSPRENILSQFFKQLTGVDSVGIHDSFFALGGDSILAIRLVGLAKQAGLVFGVRDVFLSPSIAALAALARDTLHNSIDICPPNVGLVPLTPIQVQYLSEAGHINRFHNAVVLKVPEHVTKKMLEHAIQLLRVHHDALRLRVLKQPHISLVLEPVGQQAIFEIKRVTAQAHQNQQELIQHLMQTLPDELNPEAGKMMTALWVDRPGQSALFLWVIHHLSVDGVSWRILIDDLALLIGKQSLPSRTHSVRDWAKYLHSEALNPLRQSEISIWRQVLNGVHSLPVCFVSGLHENTAGATAEFKFILQADDMLALRAEATRFDAGLDDLFLTALGCSLYCWRHERYQVEPSPILVDLEGHGRETGESGLNLSQTVGWFTSIYPVRLDWGNLDWASASLGGKGWFDGLLRVKQALRETPDRGLGFGVLRWLNNDSRKELEIAPQAQIAFNYLGRFDTQNKELSKWQFSEDIFVDGKEDDSQRQFHSIVITALTDQCGRLQIVWRYNTKSYSAASIEDLAQRFGDALLVNSTRH